MTDGLDNLGFTGNESVWKLLERDLKEANVSHAYLFAGPEGTGKYALAKTFAYMLQCKDGYCRTCNICREIEKGYHADTLEMPDDGESIKIEQIRGLLEKVNMTKTSPYKVLLLQNIERLTPPAGNALLKTLEDPPERVVFLLTARSVKEVLPTILSRVRLFKLGLLGDDELKKVLQDRFPLADGNDVDSACFFAQGRIGKGITYLGDAALLEDEKAFYDNVSALFSGHDRTQQFMFADGLAAEAKESGAQIIEKFLNFFSLALRQQMLMNIRGENAMLPLEKCVRLLQKAQATRSLLKNNVNTRLLLETLMLNI